MEAIFAENQSGSIDRLPISEATYPMIQPNVHPNERRRIGNEPLVHSPSNFDDHNGQMNSHIQNHLKSESIPMATNFSTKPGPRFYPSLMPNGMTLDHLAAVTQMQQAYVNDMAMVRPSSAMFSQQLYPFSNLTSPTQYKYDNQSFASPMGVLPPSQSNDVAALQSIQSQSDKPRVFYRNLFHTIHGKFLRDGASWEGCRVYIHDNIGYSGNAKRFKRRPEKGEKALILECNILDPKDQPVSQTCLACKDYFETQKYFKTNQECIGKIMLVKNNSPISVEGGQFKILIKMMCCCVHHSVDYFLFELNLISTLTNRKEYSAKVPLNVKQWRKSNQKKEECVLLLD